MNPLSLLTTGRTIRGLKERPGAYKLLEKSMLPNFSGTKGASPTISHMAPFEPQTEPERLEVLSVAQPAPGGMPAEPAAGTDKSRWSRLGDWARRWMPKPREKPFLTPAVQTELALDKVKVIRNDLSEDDLEVVTIDKKAAKKTEKPVQCEEDEREKMTANSNT